MPHSAKSAILFALILIVVSLGACGEDNAPPTAPTTATATRIIGLDGSLAFGSVAIGSSVDRTLTIANSGNSTLTVSGITVSTTSGSGGFAMNWTSGTIAAGATQSVTIRLTPTEARSYDGTVTVAADYTSGTNTSSITAVGVTLPPPLKTTFGPGLYGVNTEIAPGRYFSVPAFGCAWERLSGPGGTVAEIIASEFVGDNPGQWIVDIASGDQYFRTNSACGTWIKDSPPRGAVPTITAGIWLVGSQVAAGVYGSTAASGCYWERLRGFGSKGAEELIASKFVEAGGPQTVEIKADDVGFRTNSDCGTWFPVSQPVAGRAPTSGAGGR